MIIIEYVLFMIYIFGMYGNMKIILNIYVNLILLYIMNLIYENFRNS